MHIVLLPIEPLEERYSKQWLDWTLDYFNSSGHYGNLYHNDFTYDVLLPESYGSIKNGQFLDCIQTNAFKAKQLQMAIDWISKQDESVLRNPQTVFLLHDGWFPGIEMLAYIRSAMGYSFRIAACLHAGTWDTHDFTFRSGMNVWARGIETSWMAIYDHIFVATEFHKTLMQQSGVFTNPLAAPISVTGFPIFSPAQLELAFPKAVKKDLVVFPHRIAPEKRTALFETLAERASKIPGLRHFSFVQTKEACTSDNPKIAKEQYYDLLRSARYAVSFATQETWGIAMQESVMCGCIPIVPDRLSYREMYPPCFRIPDSPTLDDEVEQMLIRMVRLEGLREYAEEKCASLRGIFNVKGFFALPNMLADLESHNSFSRSHSVYAPEVAKMECPTSVFDQEFKNLL